jgi:hypothetical protein
MAMVGHRTDAIYRRYAIVDEWMLREAALKLARGADQRAGALDRLKEFRGIGKERIGG